MKNSIHTLHAYHVQIFIGGRENPRHEYIEFRIAVSTAEAALLNDIIALINDLQISAQTLDKSLLECLNKCMSMLDNLPSIQLRHSNSLRRGIFNFFQKEINAMPYPSKATQNVIDTFQKTMTLLTLPELPTPSILAHKDAPPPPPLEESPASPPSMPEETIEGFKQSIALAHKAAWEARLNHYAVPFLEGYFRKITVLIQQWNTYAPKEAKALQRELNIFCAHLTPGTPNIEKLRRVAELSLSPLKVIQHKKLIHPSKLEPNDTYKKTEVEHAVKQAYQADRSKLFGLLDEVLSAKNFVTAKHHYDLFVSQLLHMFNAYPNPNSKASLTTLCIGKLGHYTARDIVRYEIGKQLSRLRARLTHPIPEHLEEEFQALQTEYDATDSTPRQKLKSQFLSLVKQKAIDAPQNTLFECIREIKATHSTYNTLFHSGFLFNRYLFFCRHRFESLVDRLECSEITSSELVLEAL